MSPIQTESSRKFLPSLLVNIKQATTALRKSDGCMRDLRLPPRCERDLGWAA